MPNPIDRDRALLSMTSPLGKDVLIPTAFGCEERLGEPYLAVVDVISARASIDPDTLLHRPVCVALRPRNQEPRYLHGLVRRLAVTGPAERRMHGYRMEIVPGLWFLSQTADCRIFEQKTTTDILQTIFGEHGLRFQLRVGTPPPRPFTAQYNETDLDFVTRLMEEEGWFYLFAHQADAHILVVTDSNTSFNKVADGTVALRAGEGQGILSAWQPAQATAHGRIALADYDPDQPSTAVSGETSTALTAPGAPNRDPFHWPARTLKSETVQQRSRVRIEAAEAEAMLAHGSGFNAGFFAGGRIQVVASPNAASEEFLIRSVSHHATDESWRNAPVPPGYANSFTAFPSARPWRPVPRVPRPNMAGIFSAVVIGPEGQEIHTDELGRIKLRFRWDHRKDASAGSGVWVRAMQGWTGANAGWSFVPRVGTEVAVAFVDGDPDRPIVVGQLHNGEQKPPFPLPDNKTKSGLRTRSTPNGGAENYSELSFEDRKGAEQVLLHAERDLAVEVEHDAATTIDHARSVMVKQGDDSLTVQQGDRVVDVTQGDHTIKSTGGDIAIKTALGQITVEAMQSITLKVGSSSVTLDPSGVTIKGLNVQVEGTAMTSVKAPITQIDADGMLKATAGIMMLN